MEPSFEGDECENIGRSGFPEEDKAKRYGTFVFLTNGPDGIGLEIGSLIDSMEIVGFMPDVKFASFRTEVTPMAFSYGARIGETNLISLI